MVKISQLGMVLTNQIDNETTKLIEYYNIY